MVRSAVCRDGCTDEPHDPEDDIAGRLVVKTSEAASAASVSGTGTVAVSEAWSAAMEDEGKWDPEHEVTSSSATMGSARSIKRELMRRPTEGK
jgi:hypothetical protein